MKQIVFYLLALMVISSCNHKTGSGNIVTEKRQTGEFTGISVGGAFEVEIRKGPVTSVEVESDDNIIKFIETKVSGNTLKIRTRNGMNYNDTHLKVLITAPEIKSINSSGASDVKAIDMLKTNGKISLDVSGAAHVTASVDAPEVSVEASGAGNINLTGRTRDYLAKVSGSADLESANLQSENTVVHASGAGKARVHASVHLKADASGAGNIYYKGGAEVQQKISGAGNIKNDN
ncbi:MAG: head GIN domain-containing protein [Ferruginibacter sp.]